MGESFNAYQKWLGIPIDQQPPNPYRLLGVELFESDAETIHNAADRQMAHVRTFQTGQYPELCQQLLNEISAARVLLLDPQQRAAIDQQLQMAMSQQPAAAAVAVSTTAGSSVSSRYKKKQKKPGNQTMNVVKIVAGSLGGLALATVILLLIGLDPFGIAGNSDQEKDPPKERVVTPAGDKDKNKLKGKGKEKLVAREPNPFRTVDLPLSPASSDPFRLTVSDIVEPVTVTPSEVEDPPEAVEKAGDGDPPGTATSAAGLKQPLAFDEQKVRETSMTLDQASADVRRLIDAAARLEPSDRKQLADRIRESFCSVAHVVTHAKPGAVTPEVFRGLTNAFGKLAQDPPSASLLGDLASFCLGQRDPANDGIVLVGSMRSTQQLGRLFEIEIELAGNARSVVAVSKDDPSGSLNAGDRLVMLGAVVNDPKTALNGYEGTRNQVVWSGFIIALNK